MKFQKHTLSINGRRVVYWEANPKKKDVIVLLHGFPGSHFGFIDVAKGLSSKYRIILPDLPANNESEPLAEEHSLKNFSNWLNDFLAKLKIEKAVLIGHSFGTRMALVFTHLFPKKVEKMILIAPVMEAEGWLAKLGIAYYGVARYFPHAVQKIWFCNRIFRYVNNSIMFKTSSKSRRKKLFENDDWKICHPRAHIEIFNETYKTSLMPLAKKVKTKTLVIAGEKDELAKVEVVKRFAKGFPNVDFKMMKREGHIVVLESPSAVAHVINDWL